MIESDGIHDRVEGARALGLHGSVEHVPLLVRLARDDPSPGVRLNAAGAAADILSRHRVGQGRDALSRGRREDLLAAFRTLDPGVNPGLFAVLATLGLPRVLGRILVGLRDPRYDVRGGAAVGLRRFCISAECSGSPAVRRQVIAALSDRRLRPDAMVHVMRTCAACGWVEAMPAIRASMERDEQLGPSARRALDVIERAADPAGLAGSWWSLGLDAGQVAADPLSPRWLVLGDQALAVDGAEVRVMAWRAVAADRLSIDRPEGTVELDVRRMWLEPPRAELPGPALQIEGITWYACSDQQLLSLVDVVVGLQDAGLRRRAAELLLDRVPDSAPGRRACAALEIAAGRPQAAVKRLQRLIGGRKRPSSELYFWLGEALAAQGDQGGARQAWSTYLERMGHRKSPHVEVARMRLEG